MARVCLEGQGYLGRGTGDGRAYFISVVKSECLGLTTKAQGHKGEFSAVHCPHNSAKRHLNSRFSLRGYLKILLLL